MSAPVLDEEQILSMAEALANLRSNNPSEADFAEAERSIRAGEMNEWIAEVAE